MSFTYKSRLAGKEIYSSRDGHAVQTYVELGKWLGSYAQPGDVLVTFNVGAVPFFSGLPTVDTWSLVDKEIVKGNVALVGAQSDDERSAIKARLADYIWNFSPRFFMYGSSNYFTGKDNRFIGNYCQINLDHYIPGISKRAKQTGMVENLYQRSPGIGLTAAGEIPYCSE